jgi:transcriptional regulator with XRE-family HTH domain
LARCHDLLFRSPDFQDRAGNPQKICNGIASTKPVCVNVCIPSTSTNIRIIVKRIRLKRRRKAVGLTQEQLAELLSVDRSTVFRWESGESEPQPWHRPRLAAALKISPGELEEMLTPAESSPALPTESAAQAQPIEPSREDVGMLLSRMLNAEASLGGDLLYANAAAHAERLAVMLRHKPNLGLLQSFGQLSQMAGWLAIDASRGADARRHLSAAVLAAHEADDSALAASALAYMSLHETYDNRPLRSLALAEAALSTVPNPTPKVASMLHTRLARARAKLGHRQEAQTALDASRHRYAAAAHEPEPLWISYVDDVELSAQQGACYLDLGMYEEATTAMMSAISLLDSTKPGHLRDRVHYMSRLAKANLARGEIAAACAVGHEAIDAIESIGSRRILDRLEEFDTSLAEFPTTSVTGFRDRFAQLRRASGSSAG